MQEKPSQIRRAQSSPSLTPDSGAHGYIQGSERQLVACTVCTSFLTTTTFARIAHATVLKLRSVSVWISCHLA
jgi:hypothetical protein